MEDLRTTLLDLVEILSAARLDFHLTGGLASSFYGEPRFTQDIDIVLRISLGSSLDHLIKELSVKFIVDPLAVKDAVSRGRLFQALHEETMMKIDFHVGEAIEGELARSRKEEILPQVILPLVSREDAILSKLIWISTGSQKSRQDAKMMILRKAEIYFDYLQKQAINLGVDELLKQIRKETTG
jgi:hypothetical protein